MDEIDGLFKASIKPDAEIVYFRFIATDASDNVATSKLYTIMNTEIPGDSGTIEEINIDHVKINVPDEEHKTGVLGTAGETCDHAPEKIHQSRWFLDPAAHRYDAKQDEEPYTHVGREEGRILGVVRNNGEETCRDDSSLSSPVTSCPDAGDDYGEHAQEHIEKSREQVEVEVEDVGCHMPVG